MAAKMLQNLLVFMLSSVAVKSVMGQRNIALDLTDPEFRELKLGQNPDLLEFAAMAGETVTIIVNSSELLGVIQGNVVVSINCLPWLEMFPGAELRWKFRPFTSDFTYSSKQTITTFLYLFIWYMSIFTYSYFCYLQPQTLNRNFFRET